MSFWNWSPGPFWSHFLQSLNPFSKNVPQLLQKEIPSNRADLPLPPNTQKVILDPSHAEDIHSFLKEHYIIFPKSKVTLSVEDIQNGFGKYDWIGVGVYTTYSNKMIACAINRPLGTLEIGQIKIPGECGLGDFWCVEKSWRNHGIGSYVVQQCLILAASKGRLTHIFQKEGIPLIDVPAIWIGQYIYRYRSGKCALAKYLHEQDCEHNFPHIPSPDDANAIVFKPVFPITHSQSYVFQYSSYIVYLCITDLFHKLDPEGKTMGEILWIDPIGDVPYNIQALAIETLVDSCKFDMVFTDSSFPHINKDWKKDVAYAWYLYNVNPGTFFTKKPYFTP